MSQKLSATVFCCLLPLSLDFVAFCRRQQKLLLEIRFFVARNCFLLLESCFLLPVLLFVAQVLKNRCFLCRRQKATSNSCCCCLSLFVSCCSAHLWLAVVLAFTVVHNLWIINHIQFDILIRFHDLPSFHLEDKNELMLIEVFLQVLVYVCAFLVLVYIDKTDRPSTELGKSSVTVCICFESRMLQLTEILGSKYCWTTVL